MSTAIAKAALAEESKRLEREAEEASESAKRLRNVIAKLENEEILTDSDRTVMETAMRVVKLRREMEQAIIDKTGARRPS